MKDKGIYSHQEKIYIYTHHLMDATKPDFLLILLYDYRAQNLNMHHNFHIATNLYLILMYLRPFQCQSGAL